MSKISIPVLTITRTVSGDVPPHRFLGTNNAIAGAGNNTLGVTQHHGIGEDTAIDVLGVAAVETGAAVTEGSLIESDASGRAVNRTSGQIVARALESSTGAGEFVQCVLIAN